MRCGTRCGMPVGLSAWPCRGTPVPVETLGFGAARLGSARCATPWCCRLTYLSAVAPPATGSAASVQSGVLPICIPVSPPGRSNDSPVYPFSLYRGSPRAPRRSSPSLLLFFRVRLRFSSWRTPYLRPLSLLRGAAKAAARVVLPDVDQAGASRRDDILAVGYQPPRGSSRCA